MSPLPAGSNFNRRLHKVTALIEENEISDWKLFSFHCKVESVYLNRNVSKKEKKALISE